MVSIISAQRVGNDDGGVRHLDNGADGARSETNQRRVKRHPDTLRSEHSRRLSGAAAAGVLDDLCDKNFIYHWPKIGPAKRNYRGGYSERGRQDRDYFNRDRTWRDTGYGTNYYRSSPRFRNLTRARTYVHEGRRLPLSNSGMLSYNYSGTFEMTNASAFYLGGPKTWREGDRGRRESVNAIYLVQYFKTRQNSTLYVHLLGTWDSEQSMRRVVPPYPVEVRTFLGEPLMVGRCNSTSETENSAEDDGSPAPELLEDVLQFLAVTFNAT
ncbi:hypothetical protein EVAR_89059_1 [Eumeta japonica]|uniref:Uncharacterized protein n=1 Tax=Eumeta variegata TaxID=151549 RepID=A0A4C1XLU7_EUMVA|nr:hypothetical protein EVAR_89059_1 [Eumeta japonica]